MSSLREAVGIQWFSVRHLVVQLVIFSQMRIENDGPNSARQSANSQMTQIG
jgi:hypothetical protein